MRHELIPGLLTVVLICSGCSRSGSDTSGREDDASNPERWKPTVVAIETARRQAKAPLIVAATTQPRASAYDLNPRAAARAHENEETEPGQVNPEQVAGEDPAIGQIEKL